MNRLAHCSNFTLAIFVTILFVPQLAQSSDHNSLQIRLAYATQLAMADNRDDARNLLEKITDEYPDSAEAYNNLAVLTAYSEDWTGAISLLKQALATNKSLQTSYRNLNLIYRYQAALAYRAALPGNGEATLNLPDLTMLTSPVYNVAPTAETKTESETETELTGDSLSVSVAAVDDDTASTEIVAALQKWAAAWSMQDIDAYVASYVPDYIPDGGIDNASWRKLRRQRLQNPSFIEVSVFDTTVDIISPQQAMIIFTQQYRSPSYHDRVRKLMLMRLGDAGWSISREHAIQ